MEGGFVDGVGEVADVENAGEHVGVFTGAI